MKFKHSIPTMPIGKPNSSLFTIYSVNLLPEISANASAQRKVADTIQIAEKELHKFKQIYNITSDTQICNETYQKIKNL